MDAKRPLLPGRGSIQAQGMRGFAHAILRNVRPEWLEERRAAIHEAAEAVAAWAADLPLPEGFRRALTPTGDDPRQWWEVIAYGYALTAAFAFHEDAAGEDARALGDQLMPLLKDALRKPRTKRRKSVT